MKTLFLTLLSLIFSVATTAQPCEYKFQDQLEAFSELLECGGNFTLEELDSGECILKRYYPETKQITFLASYKTKKRDEYHGLYEQKWDNGTTVVSGMYMNGIKVDEWRENVNEVGLYYYGTRHGQWITYRGDTMVAKISNYVHGQLHGEQLSLDSLGNVTLMEEYDKGKLIVTTADTTRVHKEERARFPGCEDSGLEGDELMNCSYRKLLEFIYRDLKYPRGAIQEKIQGTALIKFAINEDGSVSDIQVQNGVSEDIKTEVVSIVERMPKWRPGMRDGEPIKVWWKLPVDFKLE